MSDDLARRVRALTGVRVAPPIAEAELPPGIALPADYVAFVTRVTAEIDDNAFVHPVRATAHLARAPGDFAFSPDDARRAMLAAQHWFAKGLPPGPARADLVLVADSLLGRRAFRDDYPVDEVWLRGNEEGEATLLLEDQGCGWSVGLVLAGPLRGTVWHSGEYGWLPHFYVDAAGACRAHDFASWLDVRLALLGA